MAEGSPREPRPPERPVPAETGETAEPAERVEERLVFLIGSPRSGSTLLARMLGAHPAIFAPAELHLMPPLAHLGFFEERVDRAPFDPVITQQGLRALTGLLPRGEADVRDALRALTDTLYARLQAAGGRPLLLDKTPAYALVLDFLAKLYPHARYVVLTRHPLAIWSSYVDSFFDGDFQTAHAFNPILERYVPAIGRFLRERPVPLHHLRYEDLVSDPEGELTALCKFLELEFDPGMVEYGRRSEAPAAGGRGLGDPVTVGRESRPTTRSLARWTESLCTPPERLAQGREILARLTDEDLASWGFTPRALREEVAALEPTAARPSRARLTRYALERRLLVRLRRNIHRNALGRLVRRVRTVCDVLLR